MSDLIDIADAVVAQLNAASWSETFTAERNRSKANKKITELTSLYVEVIPRSQVIELSARGELGKLLTIDIFLRKKMTPAEQDVSTGEIQEDDLDDLDDLAEDIAESFTPLQNTRDGYVDGTDASYKEVKIMSGPVTDQFTKTRIWQAQIRLTLTL